MKKCLLMLILGAVSSSAPAQTRLLTISDFRGLIGMDHTGREKLCETVEKLITDHQDDRPGSRRLIRSANEEQFLFHCEGYHQQTMVLSVKNWSSDRRSLRAESLVTAMVRKPYAEVLAGLDGLVLRDPDPAVPLSEIKSRLAKLGATSAGDFFYACGFEKLIVRDEETRATYLEKTLLRSLNSG